MAACITGLRESVTLGAVEGTPVFAPRRGGTMGSEGQEQAALISWADMMAGRYHPLTSLYHIPNEGKRSKAAAGRMVAEGLKKGVPDICLPWAAGGFIGLYIELKAGKNTATPDQIKWLKLLRRQGHFTCICYGWQAAREIIELYLQGHITA